LLVSAARVQCKFEEREEKEMVMKNIEGEEGRRKIK
jgi:hypothetical protein